jgi:hypothetical protein
MIRLTRYCSSRPLLAGLLLAALVLRGLIPAGYMPADGAAFSLQLCQAGLAGDADARGQAPGGSGSAGHDAGSFLYCSFGHAPGAGPAPQAIDAVATVQAASPPRFSSRTLVFPARGGLSPQPRAPPAFS